MTDIIYKVPAPVGGSMSFEAHIVETKEATDYLGQKVVELTQTALSRQLETNLGIWGYKYPETHEALPQFTIKNAFQPSDQRLDRQVALELRKNLEAGGTCAIAYMGHELVGLVEIARRARDASEKPEAVRSGYYLQIGRLLAARPQRGMGSMLLHAALQQVPHETGDRIIFDGLKGNSTNKWFKKLGFEIVQQADLDPITIGAKKLPRERYAIRNGRTPEQLARALEQRRRWLAGATVRE